MDLEKEVADHGERLNTVERDVMELKKDLSEGLARVDQSNQYLREQNNNILTEIIRRNSTADQRDFEIKKMSKNNQFKMFGMIFGASGLAFGLIELLLKIVK
ncbi:hypothetical protein [Companilactobacillus sp.]|uniref:hypothetical protein n=1 Tax=Companilactobacillus sp. TaxID=2767905 RepID=UPI002634AFE0|nr:hypothetical protein [Companilactobacillus sp.]